MIMPFGKHRGKTIETIADEELNYLGWLLTIPLNPILYMEVAGVYAERTGYTGEIPLANSLVPSNRISTRVTTAEGLFRQLRLFREPRTKDADQTQDDYAYCG